MPPNRFESEVESFLEGSHGDRTHIKRADHPRLHHYAGRYFEQGAETVQERLDLMLEHRDILRQRIEDLQLSLAATEFKIAMYQKGSRP